MRSLDAFGRAPQEFQVRTGFGGCLSVSSLAAVVILFLSELRYFLEPDVRDEMVVDQNQDMKYVNITLDVTLPEVPCEVLGLNVLSPKKGNVMHVVHEIYKTRLSPKTGEVLGLRLRDSLLDTAQGPQELTGAVAAEPGAAILHSMAHMRCHSCFQSHRDEDSGCFENHVLSDPHGHARAACQDDCCSTCEQVRSEFRSHGLDDRPADYVFGQCAEEAYARDGPREGEGCHVEAALYVRKVPATLHLGVKRRFRPELVPGYADDALGYSSRLAFGHEIGRLSFGPDFPGLAHLLDGRKKAEHQDFSSEHYHYDVHVIPTRYNEDGAPEVVSHQYSVTEYFKSVVVGESTNEPALGIVLSYDFTPFEVRVTRSRKSLFHFLTECCAIVGGVFAFSGMLDKFAYQAQESTGARRGGARVELASLQ